MQVTQLCPALATPWTVVRQAPLSMEFSRQEYWSGLPFPSPGDLPDPGIKTASFAGAGGFFTTVPSGKPWEQERERIFLGRVEEKRATRGDALLLLP